VQSLPELRLNTHNTVFKATKKQHNQDEIVSFIKFNHIKRLRYFLKKHRFIFLIKPMIQVLTKNRNIF